MSNPYIRHLRKLLIHKWYVFVECCKLGTPWLGIVHDCSKFKPDEFIAYAQYFYGSKLRRDKTTGDYDEPLTESAAFDVAWLHHQRRNRHHWQYWMLTQDDDDDKILSMPSKYRREMLADWYGASRAYAGSNDVTLWYLERRDKIKLHPDTRAWIEEQLEVDK
jgi:hypothetical protein